MWCPSKLVLLLFTEYTVAARKVPKLMFNSIQAATVFVFKKSRKQLIDSSFIQGLEVVWFDEFTDVLLLRLDDEIPEGEGAMLCIAVFLAPFFPYLSAAYTFVCKQIICVFMLFMIAATPCFTIFLCRVQPLLSGLGCLWECSAGFCCLHTPPPWRCQKDWLQLSAIGK